MKTTMKIIAWMLALLLAFQIVPALAAEQVISPTQGPITSYREKLEIKSETSILTAGMTTQLTATEGYSRLRWSSDNESVATVNGTGLVTAVSAGRVKITATEDGYSDSITLRVVELSTDEDTPDAESEKMIIVINASKDKKTYNGREYRSSFTAVSNSDGFEAAKVELVNENAIVTAVDCGTYTVSYRASDFAYEDADNRNVEFIMSDGWLQIKPASVTITADSKTKAEGKDDPAFTATVTGVIEGEDVSQIQYSFETNVIDGKTYIIPVADSIQGNYRVTTVAAEMIIIPPQPLYNIMKVGSTYYRLKKTEIWTNKDPVKDSHGTIGKDDYQVDDYDFTDLSVTVNNKVYIYNCKENAAAIVLGADYYDVKGGTVSIVKNKIGAMTNGKPNWLVGPEDQYTDANNTDSIHRDYEIVLHTNNTKAEEQRAYNFLGVDESNDYYKLRTTAITAKPLDQYKNGALNEGEYILESYDFTHVVLTINGVEYKYNDGTLGEYENTYTVTFEDVQKNDKFNRNDNWFKQPESWLDGAFEEYGDEPNKTTAFHANYRATTHQARERERSVTIVSDWPAGKIAYPGAEITLTATLDGFDEEYTLQWQYSTDQLNWYDENGATELTMTYTIDETTAGYYWRVVAN